MNFTTDFQDLTDFRQQIYNCLPKAADALMNTMDALLTENQAQSLPELSLSPYFQRKWHSLYEAFEDGVVETQKLRHVFAKAAPLQGKKRICLATDVSSIARPKAKTAKDRTLVHESNLPFTTRHIFEMRSPLWYSCSYHSSGVTHDRQPQTLLCRKKVIEVTTSHRT